MTRYTPLASRKLTQRTGFHRPAQTLEGRVTLDSPAIDVMTDLRHVAAVSIDPGASLAKANDRMIATGVRLLLVVDAEHCVVGLITATDILGERPILHMQQTRKHPGEVTVNDIMTPGTDLEVIQMEDVVGARVGNIVASLRRAGRQHALVVDVQPNSGVESVRGIFSSTQIARQLNTPVENLGMTDVLRELEQVLPTA